MRGELRRTVESHQPIGRELLQFLDVCQLSINRLERLRNNDLAIFLGTTSEARNKYGLRGDEILALALSETQQLQWFIPEARKRLGACPRLDLSAVLICSADLGIQRHCANIPPDPKTG